MMYKTLARFYDAIHAELTEDIPFVLHWAAHCGGDILELGCGTGRLLRPLAEAGFAVTGLDNSAEMLARATGFEQLPVSLIEGDMTRFQLPQTDYGLVLISHNTLMHLTESEVKVCLRHVHSHLREGGMVLIDIANPLLLAGLDDQPEFEFERAFLDPESGVEVGQFGRFFHKRNDQIIETEWRYDITDQPSIAATTTYHYHYPHLLNLLCRENRLAWHTTYGNYDRSLFDDDSERLIILAQKM